jgi:hypothetical protein
MVLKPSIRSYEKINLLVLLSSYQVVMSLAGISKVITLNLWPRHQPRLNEVSMVFLSALSQVLILYLKLNNYFKSYTIHDSLLIPPFHTEQSQQLTASLNKSQIN